MIVRDAAQSLPACLESVRGIVDEMIIADTGSTDNTVEVALGLGAHVIPIPWTNNFAEARNRALVAVKSNWVLSLDADERLDSKARSRFPALLTDKTFAAYQVIIRNYVLSLEDRIWDRSATSNDSQFPGAAVYPAYVEHENVRLFRHTDDIYYVGRVHESIGSRVIESGGKLGNAALVIHHFGLVADAELRARKNHFYRRLGQQKVREMPQDAQAHLELGLGDLDNFGNQLGALALFARACELNPRLGVAWFFQGLTLGKLHRWGETLQCLAEAERQGHTTSPVYESLGDAHYNLKDYAKACGAYDRALYRSPGNPRLQSKLGIAVVRAGNLERGVNLIRQAVEMKPTAGELHDRLILSLVWLDRIEQAAAAADNKIGAMEHPDAVDFLRAASLWAKLKNMPRAAAVLQVGLQVHPRDITLGRSFAELTDATDVSQYPTTVSATGSEG
jgi:glycosyltransferase involved in cell wall biosynthesis